MQTVTRAHLAETIYTQVGLSRNESADLLETVLERVSAALEAGESVKISGFGTFSVRQRDAVSDVIPRPVRKCRYCHAVCWCSGLATS